MNLDGWCRERQRETVAQGHFGRIEEVWLQHIYAYMLQFEPFKTILINLTTDGNKYSEAFLLICVFLSLILI